MTDIYKVKLQELSKLIKDEINIIQNGGKLSSFKRQIKPRQRQLKNELVQVIKIIATKGEIPSEWVDIRNYFIVMIRQLLENFNNQCKDCKTFEQQKEVILQFFVFFDKPPFTIQRIAQVILEPKKYYKSTKKLLYALQKLVNVGDPDQR